MNTLSTFTSSIKFARTCSYSEKTLSALSRYFYLGGNRVTVHDGNQVTLQANNLSWKLTAAKVTSYIILCPVTVPLFIVNLGLRVYYFKDLTSLMLKPAPRKNRDETPHSTTKTFPPQPHYLGVPSCIIPERDSEPLFPTVSTTPLPAAATPTMHLPTLAQKQDDFPIETTPLPILATLPQTPEFSPSILDTFHMNQATMPIAAQPLIESPQPTQELPLQATAQSLDNPSGQETAELTIAYGEHIDQTVDEVAYDRLTNFTKYENNNKDNPLKNRKLKITYVAADDEEIKIKRTLRNWILVAEKMEEDCYAKAECDWTTADALATLSVLAGNILKKQYPASAKICTIEDREGNIQGISIIDYDPRHATACKIHFLLSAPHNILKLNSESDEKVRVEGVGTALIENAVEQSLNYRGISSRNVRKKDLLASAVTLRAAPSSDQFYHHIFFQYYNDSGAPTTAEAADRILTGPHLVQFLNKYGGRAQPEMSPTILLPSLQQKLEIPPLTLEIHPPASTFPCSDPVPAFVETAQSVYQASPFTPTPTPQESEYK